MQFQTIHTRYGLAKIAAAITSGVPINLPQMAVGDGGGNPVTPTDGQTGLVREMFRAAVNRVYQDPVTTNKYTCELVIPATTGGFVLREVGIFDSAGGLFAVGNLPDTYKPMATEGAFADTVVRLSFLVTNAGIITLQIDPNVAVATQTWISNNVTAGKLLPGGTTGQILKKNSNRDGDTSWADPSITNVVVSVIEEHQTLVAGQTAVTLSSVTTRGLAVYIEGVRLDHGAGVHGWLEDATTPATKINLGAAYPDGSYITLVQNTPLGSVPFPLSQAANFSDVLDAPTARRNINVPSVAEANASGQPGMIAYFAGSSAPAGWMKANGAAISRTAYANLFAVIGGNYGTGDGFTTFNLPDLRGEFIRSADDGRGVDSGRTIGSWQADQFASHVHYYQSTPGLGQGQTGPNAVQQSAGVSVTSATGGNETRPRNIALLACIKY